MRRESAESEMQTSGPQATADDTRTVGAETGGDGPAGLTARVPGDSAIGVGERIMLRPRHDQVHVFSPTTGERLD